MFVPKTKNQVSPSTPLRIATILSIAFLASTSVGVFPVPAFASPVTPERLVELTNQARTDNGLATLSVNSLLVQSAQGKSNDMLEKNYFAHTSPDGKSPWEWFKEVGYNYIYAGENLAKNFASAEAMFDAWMASPTHRANILSGNFKEIGIAMASNGSALYVTQHFGSRSAAAGDEATATPTPPVAQSKPQPKRSTPADTTAPEIADVTPSQKILKQGGTIDFALTVTGDPVKVTVKAGEKTLALTQSNDHWVGQLTLYAGGTYEVTVSAQDAAGNTATKSLGTVTVEVPELERPNPDLRTIVAAYWKDVATNEAAPISLALIVILALVGGYVWQTRQLSQRLFRLVLPIALRA